MSSMNEDRPLFMGNDMIKYQAEASKLINWGYRRISNTGHIVSRIDRADWYRYMAQQHAPWDPNGSGIDWVFCMGNRSAENHYRRCYSEDKITVSYEVSKLIPTSDGSRTGYCRKKGEPDKDDVCRGDIEMSSTISRFVEPKEILGKFRIHGMNVVTGRVACPSNKKFYDDFDEAVTRAKSIVKRDADVQICILQVTHVVQATTPPIEVVGLDE